MLKRHLALAAALLSALGSHVSGAQLVRIRGSIDSLVRRGSELGFENEVRQLGCTPLRPALGADGSWHEGLRLASAVVRAQIVGTVPSKWAGEVLERYPYVDDANYRFGRVLIGSRLGEVPTFAYVMEPSRAATQRAVVILLHGSGTLPHQAFDVRLDGEGDAVTRPDSSAFIGIGLSLVQAGFTVIAPILGRVPAQRVGELPWLSESLWGEILREKMGKGGTESFLISEVEAFIDFAIRSKLAQDDQIFVVGWNEGAYLAALTASLDPRVRGVVRLESPLNRRDFRNYAGLRRDASFAHAECVLGDVAQASLLGGKPLMYASASDDANEIVRYSYRSRAVDDSLKSFYAGMGKPENLLIEKSGLRVAPLQAVVAQWLAAKSGIVRPGAGKVPAPQLTSAVKFPLSSVVERVNIVGVFLGRLPSCPSVLSRVAESQNDPEATSGVIAAALGVTLGSRGANSRILSRRMLDSSRGYRLSHVVFGGAAGLRWSALLAEPKGAGLRPAVLSFNGIDDLDDLFAIKSPKIPYLHGYADELAKRGFIVLVPIVPNWLPDTFAGITSARSIGRSSVWRLLLDTYLNGVSTLLTLPDVDPTRVAAYGISGGGITASLVTAIDPRIRALVYSNVPVDYRSTFDTPAGALTNLWLANACGAADASLLAIAPRQLIWEAGEDPLARSAGMDIVARVRNRYRRLGQEELFTFTRHSAGHETFAANLRIFGR